MSPLLVVALHTEADSPEQPEKTNNDGVQRAEDSIANGTLQLDRRPVDAESQRQDGKPQSGVVVMHVGNTSHDEEGEVVEKPADDRVDTGIVDLVDISLLEIREAALPAQGVPGYYACEDAERCG